MNTFLLRDIFRQIIDTAKEAGVWTGLTHKEKSDLVDAVLQECCEQLLCGNPGAGLAARFAARGRIDVLSHALKMERLARRAA